MRRTTLLAVLSTIHLAVVWASGAQAQGLPPGKIAFAHEDSGQSDPVRLFSNLRVMDSGAPAQQTALTRISSPAVFVGAPAWSRDRRQLAFVSNFNALGSQEAQSVFIISADGTGLRQVTGSGVVQPHPGPTGTVRGRVVAPAIHLGAGSAAGRVTGCTISAQGSTRTASCDLDGSFVLQNVPVGSVFVRAQGSVSYAGAIQGTGPGLSVGFATISVRAGQVTDVGTITLQPSTSKAVEVSWSPDGSHLVVTHQVQSQSLQADPNTGAPKWQGTGGKMVSIWSASGELRGTISVPGLPEFELSGADWSPAGDRLVLAANGSGFGSSFVGVIGPDGSDPRAIYQVPADVFSSVIHFVRQCRWSPDGRRIAFTQLSIASDASAAWSDLFVINADGTGLRRLTSAAPTQFVTSPTWSPDGQFVAFDVQVSPDLQITVQRTDLFAIRADGTGLTQLTNDGRSYSPAW